MSCGTVIKGPAVVVMTKIREDNYAALAYIVHEACQTGMLLDVPFDDESSARCAGRLCLVDARKTVSEPVFCSLCINPRLSRKMCPRARIYALYGRSMRARGSRFSWSGRP